MVIGPILAKPCQCRFRVDVFRQLTDNGIWMVDRFSTGQAVIAWITPTSLSLTGHLVECGQQNCNGLFASSRIGRAGTQRLQRTIDYLVHHMPVRRCSRFKTYLGRVPRHFKVLDARGGTWQIPLNDQGRDFYRNGL